MKRQATQLPEQPKTAPLDGAIAANLKELG